VTDTGCTSPTPISDLGSGSIYTTSGELKAAVPLFDQRVTATLKRCTDTLRERGDQYGDTWADCQWLKLRAVLFSLWGMKISATQCRALALACFSDMKYQRLQGGYTPDHLIDGINYDAALAEEMQAVYRLDE
jgi:hypothetical protein